MDYTNSYVNILSTLRDIADEFSVNSFQIREDIDKMNNFFVTVPVIGCFSAGKSSLINAVLRCELMSSQITPETSVATEISFGEESCYLQKGYKKSRFDIGKLYSLDLPPDSADFISIKLENDFLCKIPNVKIVDTPGFNSNLTDHNRIIRNYLPLASLYIVTIPADEPVIKESLLEILQDLKKLPIYFVLTKCDKITEEAKSDILSGLPKTISKLLNIELPEIFPTSAKKNSDAEPFRELLIRIQQDYPMYLSESFDAKISLHTKELRTILNNMFMLKRMEISHKQEQIFALESGTSVTLEKLGDNFFSEYMDKFYTELRSKIAGEFVGNSVDFKAIFFDRAKITPKIQAIISVIILSELRNTLFPKLKSQIDLALKINKINDSETMFPPEHSIPAQQLISVVNEIVKIQSESHAESIEKMKKNGDKQGIIDEIELIIDQILQQLAQYFTAFRIEVIKQINRELQPCIDDIQSNITKKRTKLLIELKSLTDEKERLLDCITEIQNIVSIFPQ